MLRGHTLYYKARAATRTSEKSALIKGFGEKTQSSACQREATGHRRIAFLSAVVHTEETNSAQVFGIVAAG